LAVTLPVADILERWDADHNDDPDDPLETSLGEWLERSEVGDSFANLDETWA